MQVNCKTDPVLSRSMFARISKDDPRIDRTLASLFRFNEIADDGVC
jgi:hypothetical protein